MSKRQGEAVYLYERRENMTIAQTPATQNVRIYVNVNTVTETVDKKLPWCLSTLVR